MAIKPLGVPLDFGAEQFIGAIRKVSLAERLPVPSVFGTITYGNPTLGLPGVFIHFVRGLKVDWQFATGLDFISLGELPISHEAASPIELPCSYSLAINDPFGARN